MPATLASSSTSPLLNRQTIADRKLWVGSGYVMLLVAVGLIILSLWLGIAELIRLAPNEVPLLALGLALLGIIVSLVLLTGLVILQPNESLVCLFFGSYVGTERRSGFWWVNPFNSRKRYRGGLRRWNAAP